MEFISTRDSKKQVSGAQAVLQGISEDGGLFVPNKLPTLTSDDLKRLAGLDYAQQATEIISLFFTDFTADEIKHCTESAYNSGKFDTEQVYELAELGENTWLLELWHGPTCAFKDMALQILPYFLTTSAKKLNFNKKIMILVATSGDTGKAALDGFSDVDGTGILVFYPEDGVSDMQKLQMTTQEGSNVKVCAVKGNFDDCQTGVKEIFGDASMKAFADDCTTAFSSANSINFGRLLPQIVYYISAYVRLVAKEKLTIGDTVNVVVPTGNFGNILAAWYAKQMGVPFGKLICASNKNNVLTDFIESGRYDRNRKFYTTTSPSMDILISSNLERLVFELTGRDDAAVRELFTSLKKDGSYTISPDMLNTLKSDFTAGFCDDERTASEIKHVFEKYSYLSDTHTAVALAVYDDYVEKTGDHTPTIIASTASPYKFCGSVLEALGSSSDEPAVKLPEKLAALTKTSVPAPLAALGDKTVRFKDSVSPEEMSDYVREALR